MEVNAQRRVSTIRRHLCQADPCPATCAVVIGAGATRKARFTMHDAYYTTVVQITEGALPAGVVGLAVARSLALSGHRVTVLEAEADIGTSTSARNSQVVHAGDASVERKGAGTMHAMLSPNRICGLHF